MGPKTPPPASLPRAVVLSCRWVCLPGDVWQFLETLLVVIMERGWCCYWHFAGETELLLNIPQRPGRPPQQGTTQPKLSLVPLRATLAQRDGGKLWFTCFSRKCKIYTSTFFIFFFTQIDWVYPPIICNLLFPPNNVSVIFPYWDVQFTSLF